MKNEIFKVSYSIYQNDEYCDYNPLDVNHCADIREYRQKNKKQTSVFVRKSFDNLEETFAKNYGNPLYGVAKEHFMVVIEKYDNKVSLKYFYYSKHRRPGCSWFKLIKNMYFITVNLKTGDVYNGSLNNYQKKKCTKTLKRNLFYTNPLESFKQSIRQMLIRFTNDFKMDESPDLNKKNVQYNTMTLDIISKFMFEVDGKDDFLGGKYSERLFEFYLKKKGIKYPNNFSTYMCYGNKLPTLKDLKKNEFKYVDTFMKLNNIHGKKLRKALHICNHINLSVYKLAVKMFGDDMINNNEDVLLASINSKFIPWHQVGVEFSEVFSPEELKRVFKIFKQVVINETLDFSTFFDHVRTYVELKSFGEDIKWNSYDNKKDFAKEHLDWMDKLQHYKQGTYFRVYPEYMDKFINKPIKTDTDVYYPVLLTNSIEYNHESQIQSNCVKGYVGRASSVIISLRKNQIDSEERGTIEYEISKKDKTISVRRVQYLGRFNEKLDEKWNEILLNLDEVMSKCFKDKRYENVKLRKECSNGVILHSDSEFSDNGFLFWTYKNIENNNYTNFNLNLDF
jgi:hypothetical protein